MFRISKYIETESRVIVASGEEEMGTGSPLGWWNCSKIVVGHILYEYTIEHWITHTKSADLWDTTYTSIKTLLKKDSSKYYFSVAISKL